MSSRSLLYRLTFRLAGAIELRSDTEGVVDPDGKLVSKVPRDPSGKDNVCISIEDTAVVGLDSKPGLFGRWDFKWRSEGEDFRTGIFGRGGKVGRSSGSP